MARPNQETLPVMGLALALQEEPEMRPGFHFISMEVSKERKKEKKKQNRQSWGSQRPGTPQLPVELAFSKSGMSSSLHALAGVQEKSRSLI